MSLIVQKYGGSSVATTERMELVANHICNTLQSGTKLLCVVSAMGKQTNELIQLAQVLHPHPPKREMDMLLSVGERVSMALMSIALNRRGVRAISLTGSQSGILTDHTHGNARIARINPTRIEDSFLNNDVVIVAGFQGVNPQSREITTLGRGGSDLSAVALAQVLRASQCEIYTDVEGVCSADPRLAPKAKVIDHLYHDELLDLAWHGAKVMHARAAHLCAKYKINVAIRSSFDFSKPGTLIKGDRSMDQLEDAKVRAVAHKNELVMFDVRTKADHYEFFYRCNRWLWDEGESPVINHSHWQDGELKLTQCIPLGLADRYKEFLIQNDKHCRIHTSSKSLCSISLVGQGFWQSPEFVEEATRELPEAPLYLDSKNNVLTFVLQSERLQDAVSALHKRFVEG